jgi:nanoRNase/pAp phosphatase (c-di-AMP/oligoRNAs hydrolase)
VPCLPAGRGARPSSWGHRIAGAAVTVRQEERRYHRLREALAGVRRVLVLLHDHPDPDALASGLILHRILRRAIGLRSDIGYGGLIGRSENRVMVAELRIPLLHRSQLRFEHYDAIALVDTQPGSGNNSLPADRDAGVVFDHHPLRHHTREAPFTDVRPGYGATATILCEYLHAAGLAPDRCMATAAFHAIRSETQNLGREGTPADARVFTKLFAQVDNHSLARIEQAPFAREYLAILSRVLRTARLYGGVALAPLGPVPYPDAPAQLADFVLRVEGVQWALAFGLHRGQIYLSLRAANLHAHAGDALRRIVGERGRAGGHGPIAGGRIPLARGAGAAAMMRLLQERARKVLGGADGRGRPLMPGRPCPAKRT